MADKSRRKNFALPGYIVRLTTKIIGWLASSARAALMDESVSANADADVSNFQRIVARLSCFWISSLIVFPPTQKFLVTRTP